ncbi:aspartate dehydrogenase [Curvibacter sp. HBC61]|uniref:L-aspartate dehydrogenase n=1 Tax=Curvibacter cyanobacteriorum TaxID=3026422 RepID=A0ABT5MVZ0_9BURK|nr:aspartate dehydrogenase [Curvibacter sp. HBC61]MDD0838007.1 aspartate dehydrogenase [Curvibacter sp. HBC61]
MTAPMASQRPLQRVTLIGFGAIGQSIFQRAAQAPGVHISHVVVPATGLAKAQARLGAAATACTAVPEDATLVLECAGHSALLQHVLPALQRGVECAVLSIGALAGPGLAEQLSDAAEQGGTQVHLLAGAMAGVDALAAARLAGLSEVCYTGRKPPAGWRDTPAEQVCDLDTITQATVLLDATAREAAQRYPKNANVAATLSLAGLGLDATRVRLIADPAVSENIHHVVARGEFGEIELTLRGKPLADNPKTSALTVLSGLRFLHNRGAALTL